MSNSVETVEKDIILQNGKEGSEIQEHIIEIISDPGEGAQSAGQAFGTISAKMGNGIWTEEIIPAEIQPPPRNANGASGNRVRIGSFQITNGGDESDLVIAFNEQVLVGREKSGNFKSDCVILLENKWRFDKNQGIANAYKAVYEELSQKGYRVIEIPMEEECLKHVPSAKRGKNMFALGLLCRIYDRDIELAKELIEFKFAKKGQEVVDANFRLLEAGHLWATENLEIRFKMTSADINKPQIVVNGNSALALGIMASGMEVCAMYPITPATSASHYLSEIFEKVGGVVHQAEDEISACAFAIGASYAGKCAVTITSGPGMSLKTELIGLAVMAEIPLVLINVQRGGPSTGLPTKVEQGDLLAAMFSSHGDAPKVVMAPATIEDCFYSVITARKIAETFRIPVILLSDANLATGQQPFQRPVFSKEWVAPPIDQSPAPADTRPYNWDPKTGISRRFIPGQPKGEHTLTGLAHDREARVAYEAGINEDGLKHRSLKLAAFQKTLKTPSVFGEPEGELLIIGWGSTKGAIEEAIRRVQREDKKVSSLHLKFLQPMASGLKGILKKFKKVMTVEMNYSDSLDDEIINEDNRRFSSLAFLLRARYLVDVECWSQVQGRPIRPGDIENMIREELSKIQ